MTSSGGTAYVRHGKRILDIVAALSGMVLLAPVLLMVAAFVRLRLGRPILFRQDRPGQDGLAFSIVKFRTMSDARDSSGRWLPNGERLSRPGAILRALSLDELPELFNVLKGDMSLVRPRPLFMQYVDRYSPEQARRHEVPGITGLAQVNGRNAISWERKFGLDVEYVDRCSLALDLKILALTAWRVVAREGISQPRHATAEEFMGTPGR
jgi:lipopolysaccharide/colanic/teichoic acid biosynthesis glycosyltransferase